MPFPAGLAHAILSTGVSLILSVRDDVDIVMASDGRVLGEDLGVISDDSLKTLALNASLCLGLAGSTDAIRQILSSFGIRCRGTHPVDLLGVCQEASCPVDVDYLDARDEVTNVLRWIGRRTSTKRAFAQGPAVILAGRTAGGPALCRWHNPAHAMEATGASGYGDALVGSLPEDGTHERSELCRIVRAGHSTHHAEERLTRAVRFCARYFGAAGPVNETVFLRRLSRGFRLVRAEPTRAARP